MNNMDNANEPKYNTLVVINRVSTGDKLYINCNTKDKLKDVIQRYRLKSQDNKSNKFIHNGMALDFEKTIEESGINKGNIIVGIEPTLIG